MTLLHAQYGKENKDPPYNALESSKLSYIERIRRPGFLIYSQQADFKPGLYQSTPKQKTKMISN